MRDRFWRKAVVHGVRQSATSDSVLLLSGWWLLILNLHTWLHYLLYLRDALLQDKAEVWRNLGSTKHQWLYKWIVYVHQRLRVSGESTDVSMQRRICRRQHGMPSRYRKIFSKLFSFYKFFTNKKLILNCLFKTWVLNPLSARFYFAAPDNICKLCRHQKFSQ
jgi:hypothetical protein